MLDENPTDVPRTEATPSPGHELARHRERVLRAELERRVELFDQLEDAQFGKFGALDWTLCTAVFFLLPILVAWWAL